MPHFGMLPEIGSSSEEEEEEEKKKKVAFELADIVALVHGVEKYGRKWKEILKKEPHFINTDKTVNNLKVKWRNLRNLEKKGFKGSHIVLPHDLKLRIVHLVINEKV